MRSVSYPYLEAARQTGAPYGTALQCATVLERLERAGWSPLFANLCSSFCEPEWRPLVAALNQDQYYAILHAYMREMKRRKECSS